MTNEETTEAMQMAMTVGATRMQVMLGAEQTKLDAPRAGRQPEPEPPAAAKPAAPAITPPPAFAAAEVVPQAGGG